MKKLTAQLFASYSAALSQPPHFFSHSAFLQHSSFLSQSAHFSSVHFSLQQFSLQHFSSAHFASVHLVSQHLSSPHLVSQHSVFFSQHESVHSVFLLLQHEHEATTIIAAAIAKDIKILFIVNLFFKWLNKSTKSQIYKKVEEFASDVIRNYLSVQFIDLHRVDSAVIDLESDGSTYDMKALNAGRTRIYYKHIPAGIPHYFQDMRMSAYK